MRITLESEAHQMIEELRQGTTLLQAQRLRKAVESLELNQMYYEQKGNDNAAERTGRCIAILKTRLVELG